MRKSSKPIIEHIPEFLEYLDVERGLSNKSQETYNRLIKKFSDWLEKNNLKGLLPHQLDQKHLWDYRVYLSRQINPNKKAPLTRNTQNHYLISLRNLLRFFADRDIVSLPAEKIKLPKNKSDQRIIKFLPLEHIKKLLGAPDVSTVIGLRDKCILETFFSTGLRIAELVNLDKEQLKIKPGVEELEIVVIGKGNRPRPVYFSKRAVEWLRKYLDTRKDKEKALFIAYNGPKRASQRLSCRSIENIVKKYAIASGVPNFTTPHTLRHCLHPSTRIFLTNQVVSARNLFFKEFLEAQTIDWSTLKISKEKIIDKSYHITPLFSLWADGYNLVCSPNHRLFTIGKSGIEEIMAKDLKLGDYMMGIKKVSLSSRKPFINPKLSRLLGYTWGDGTVNRDNRSICLDDKDKSILELYSRIVQELFTIKPILKKSKVKNSWQLKIYNKELVEFILSLGFQSRAKFKTIPPEILNSPKEELSEFIAGYYDADGNSGSIRFFSSSLDLLKDVQMGLLRFGIDSHINFRERTVMLPQKREFSHTMYTLGIIHRPDQLLFTKNIKTIKKKFLGINDHFNGEKLPVGSLLESVRKDARKKKVIWVQKLRENYSINDLGRYVKHLHPTRKTVKKIINQLEKEKYNSDLLKILKRITYSENIKWLKLKEKTRLYSSRHTTFDFGLNKDVGNIITDGIVSHNSFATDLLEKGVDLREIQEFLGHKNIGTTQIYAHVTSKKLKDIHRKFHGLGNEKSAF